MAIELVLIALRDLRSAANSPKEQVAALVERIKTLRLLLKEEHPEAQYVFTWPDNSLIALDDCTPTGLSKEDKRYLKSAFYELTREDPNLHVLTGASPFDKAIKDQEELQQMGDLYALHAEIKEQEKAKQTHPEFSDHEQDYLALLKQPFKAQSQKRVISMFYFHQSAYLRHDKRAPFKESYNPSIVWQPPKEKHVDNEILIKAVKTQEVLRCQVAICRELAFMKLTAPLVVFSSNQFHLDPERQDLSKVSIIFQSDSAYTTLYLTDNYSSQMKVTCYENSLRALATKLRKIEPISLKTKREPEAPFFSKTESCQRSALIAAKEELPNPEHLEYNPACKT